MPDADMEREDVADTLNREHGLLQGRAAGVALGSASNQRLTREPLVIDPDLARRRAEAELKQQEAYLAEQLACTARQTHDREVGIRANAMQFALAMGSIGEATKLVAAAAEIEAYLRGPADHASE